MKRVNIPNPECQYPGGIYVIVCLPTMDFYVGKSKNIHQRMFQHIHRLKQGTHNNPGLQSLWNKYSPEDFLIERIEEVRDPSTLETREVYWTAELKPTLNIVDTRLSPADVLTIKQKLAAGTPQDVILAQYKLTSKYLREILRGSRWSTVDDPRAL